MFALSNTVASTLSLPSAWLLTRKTPAPLWTTQYYIYMHYVTHTLTITERCYTEVQNELWIEKLHLVARTVWAASVVLPILDAVAWLFKQFALLDPQIRQQYELEELQQRVFRDERLYRALGSSVWEFTVFFLAASYRHERSEGMALEESYQRRNDAFNNFCSHFANGDPREAFLLATRSIIQLYEMCKIEDRPILEAFQAIEAHLMREKTSLWLKDEQDNPLHDACSVLVDNYKRFFQLCHSS